MAINLELKLKIKSTRNYKDILNKRAKYIKTFKQKDIYYKYKNGLLKLRIENGNYYLIKYNRNETGQRWSNYNIVELKAKNIEKFLDDILERECIVEKVRTLYKYKNTRIHIDNVNNLGRFLELETVVNKNKKEAQKEFHLVVELLKLNLSDQIRKSYKDLLMQ